MAVELVDATQLDSDLTDIADAIRLKGGTSASLAFPAGFVQAIGDIPTGGSSVEHIFTYIPASYSSSAALSVGDYVVDPSRLAIFLMSDNSVNDPTYETMVGGYSCYVTENNILAVNGHNPRGFQVTLKANSGNDFWNSTFTVSQNATTITVGASRNYKPGAEYTFFFYDLNADL